MSNRADEEVLSIFFYHIKNSVGQISARVFMSDVADQYYTTWSKIKGAVDMRLYCIWHVDRAWRKNLPKIKTKEKQAEIYKDLRTILHDTDLEAFKIMLENFYQKLNTSQETEDFASYFLQYYMRVFERWTYCCRLNAGVNTNMHLERLHKTKYVYLKGKRVKSLDKGIGALMTLVRDKLFDRLIIINKGKIGKKLTDIRSRHKSSRELDSETIMIAGDGWDVLSATKTQIYHVHQVNPLCNCQLICTDCKASLLLHLHRFHY